MLGRGLLESCPDLNTASGRLPGISNRGALARTLTAGGCPIGCCSNIEQRTGEHIISVKAEPSNAMGFSPYYAIVALLHRGTFENRAARQRHLISEVVHLVKICLLEKHSKEQNCYIT